MFFKSKLLILIIAGLVLIVVVYLFYVRGVGTPLRITEPQEILREEKTRIYSWSIKKEMPTHRTEVVAVEVGGKVYVIGGFDGLGRTVATVEIYDPENDSWERGIDLPEGRHHAMAASVGGNLYVIGGYSGLGFSPESDVFEFHPVRSPVPTKVGITSNGVNPSRETWLRKASLPIARGAGVAALINEKVYIVGGVASDGLTGRLEIYNPTLDSWERRRDAPTKRDHLAAAFLDGKLYVAGGREQSLSKNFSTFEIYDPLTDEWLEGPPLPTPRGGVVGVSFDGLFVVAGGEALTKTFYEVEAYDPKENRWRTLPRLPSARHGLSAVTIDDKMYVIGGGKRPGLSVSGSNEVLEVKPQ